MVGGREEIAAEMVVDDAGPVVVEKEAVGVVDVDLNTEGLGVSPCSLITVYAHRSCGLTAPPFFLSRDGWNFIAVRAVIRGFPSYITPPVVQQDFHLSCGHNALSLDRRFYNHGRLPCAIRSERVGPLQLHLQSSSSGSFPRVLIVASFICGGT